MTSDLILEMVEVVIAMARSQKDSDDVKQTLLDIADKAAQAVEDHMGEELDPLEIEAEDEV
jgi:hypothetical protein